MHISAGISHSLAKVLACEVQITSTCVQGYFYLSACRADGIALTLCCPLRVRSSHLCCSVVLKFTRLKDFYSFIYLFFRNVSIWLTFFIRLISRAAWVDSAHNSQFQPLHTGQFLVHWLILRLLTLNLEKGCNIGHRVSVVDLCQRFAEPLSCVNCKLN